MSEPPVERGERMAADEAARVWSGLADGSWIVVALGATGPRRTAALRRAAGAALSGRERAAVAHAAAGRSNKEIGFLLGVAPSTAAGVLAAACGKLGLRSRRELIALFAAAAAPAGAEAGGPPRRDEPAG